MGNFITNVKGHARVLMFSKRLAYMAQKTVLPS